MTLDKAVRHSLGDKVVSQNDFSITPQSYASYLIPSQCIWAKGSLCKAHETRWNAISEWGRVPGGEACLQPIDTKLNDSFWWFLMKNLFSWNVNTPYLKWSGAQWILSLMKMKWRIHTFDRGDPEIWATNGLGSFIFGCLILNLLTLFFLFGLKRKRFKEKLDLKVTASLPVSPSPYPFGHRDGK